MTRHFLVVALALLAAQSCTYNVQELIRDRGVIHKDTHITIRSKGVQVTYPAPRRKEAGLPELCRQFYNDGSGRWAECIGVGPK